MSLVITILAGALIGWLASKVMGTDAQMGAIANIIAGIVGSAIAGFFFGTGGPSFNIVQIIAGVLGACVLIAIVKALFGGGRRTTV